MLQRLYRAGLFAALFGLMFMPGEAWAQKSRAHKVDDELELFSKNAVENANTIIAQIKEKHRKDLVIETRKEGPAKDKASAWAIKRADTLGVDGVYIMISKVPQHFEVYVGNKTGEKLFTDDDRKHLKKLLAAKLGKNSDEALRDVVAFTRDEMARHNPTPQKKAQQGNAPVQRAQPVQQPDTRRSEIPPWVGWLCLIAGVLFVVWIVFAIIRAMTGAMGGGGGGYGGGGGGYGGGGYGGGGGGFMTGMLGGLFGSMAGMWMYNNMFGGHATYNQQGGVNWGGNEGSSAAGSSHEADTGGTSEGGDWGAGGNDAGGKGGGGDEGGGDWGDAGKGGGDAGDGGDVGGGGEWGGGGDAGGGDTGGDTGGGGGWFGGGDAGGGDAGGGGDWGGGGDAGGGGDSGGGGGGDW